MKWLSEDDMDFVVMYHTQPDWEGHLSGVDLSESSKLLYYFREVDSMIGIYVFSPELSRMYILQMHSFRLFLNVFSISSEFSN